MADLDFMVALRRETDAMRAVVESLPLDTPIPTCPGWTALDLVVHTGIVHRHKADTVRQGLTDRGAESQKGPEGDVIAWFDEGIDDMLEVFASADLSAPTWTWCDHEHDVVWWVRRMAHETLIHGADAAMAAGRAFAVDEGLAEDGIEEILAEMMVGYPEWAEMSEGDMTFEVVAPSKSWILSTCTWSGESPNTGISYTDEEGVIFAGKGAEPDVRIIGSASELDLWLWGRGPRPEVDGDENLADRVRAIAAAATQ